MVIFFFLPGSLLCVDLVITTYWSGILSVCISKSPVWSLGNGDESHYTAFCDVVLARNLVVHFTSTEICPELHLKDQVGFISYVISEPNTSSSSSGNPEMLDILVKVQRFKFCESRISHLVWPLPFSPFWTYYKSSIHSIVISASDDRYRCPSGAAAGTHVVQRSRMPKLRAAKRSEDLTKNNSR